MPILVLAARETSTTLNLCLVCRTALNCVLPELYRDVTLTSAFQIVSFQKALLRSEMHSVEGEQGPASKLPSLVRKLWIGPRTCLEMQDLDYASNYWPVPTIHYIFSICLNIRSLAILNLDQSMWFCLEHIIPSSVETLYMGPIHGSLSLKDMRCFSNLHSIVSANTYMPDWEVKEIVTSPHCRRFCRFFQWSFHIESAFHQLKCIAEADGLEDMQIVVFGHGDFENKVQKMVAEHEQSLQDTRVSIVCRPSPICDWMRSLYSQWVAEA